MNEQQIIIRLLDSFEFYNVGMCCMIADVYQEKKIISEKEWINIDTWLTENIPPLKFNYLKGMEINLETALYPWPVEISDSIDRRWYWLKDQLSNTEEFYYETPYYQ